jgi:hypothetical protein
MASDAKVKVGYKRYNSSSVVPRSNILIHKLSGAQRIGEKKGCVTLVMKNGIGTMCALRGRFMFWRGVTCLVNKVRKIP